MEKRIRRLRVAAHILSLLLCVVGASFVFYSILPGDLQQEIRGSYLLVVFPVGVVLAAARWFIGWELYHELYNERLIARLQNAERVARARGTALPQ